MSRGEHRARVLWLLGRLGGAAQFVRNVDLDADFGMGMGFRIVFVEAVRRWACIEVLFVVWVVFLLFCFGAGAYVMQEVLGLE
ncbi:hypothetical protein BS50DRAFT_578836 [Corynespora cassiicola Philippines]|uniref:Uncharacterized protein n=1 Tax=Corynespora cassiicola Philippines TaxID=1448308 RepID=A0A2T2N6I3_CORCC|nr:hypothetical protein BS50DRAFT_578836 [Corynespora cassiicola Philippines]